MKGPLWMPLLHPVRQRCRSNQPALCAHVTFDRRPDM
jgi:hypothetical protein